MWHPTEIITAIQIRSFLLSERTLQVHSDQIRSSKAMEHEPWSLSGYESDGICATLMYPNTDSNCTFHGQFTEETEKERTLTSFFYSGKCRDCGVKIMEYSLQNKFYCFCAV